MVCSVLNFGILLYLSGISNIKCAPPAANTAQPGLRDQYEARVAAMAKNGQLIDGVLKPTGEKRVGLGAFGFVWKGLMGNTEVALKFDKEFTEKEFKIFEILKATNKNKTVEDYGIPAIYHRCNFDAYNIIAMTFIGESAMDVYNRRQYSDLDILLLFKRIFRVLKYLHSMGIIHNDLKPENILFRGDEVFIIDFNIARIVSKNMKPELGGNRKYGALKFHQDKLRFEIDDVESVVYLMLTLIRIVTPWWSFGDISDKPYIKEKKNRKNIFGLFKQIRNPHVRGVYEHAFGMVVFGAVVPNYDGTTTIIDNAIREIRKPGEKLQFSWLTPYDETKIRKLPEITTIRSPLDNVNLSKGGVGKKIMKILMPCIK